MKIRTYNINFPIILRTIGLLLMIEACFMVLPLLVSLYYGEQVGVKAFAQSLLITFVTGAAMAFLIRPKSMSMAKREGLFLTAVTWVFFSIFGLLPYILSGTLPGVTDAFFETMSGFTTTGATVLRDIDTTQRGVLFWRSMTQWIGGMGIILFTLAVLPMLNYKGGIALFNAEVTGITHERLRPRISQTAKELWLLYILLTIVMALLITGPLGWFDAVCHTMSTVSTGGFSTKSTGLGYWHNYYVDVVVMVFMFLSGTNFPLLLSLSRGKWSRLRHNDTFKWYVGMMGALAALIFIRIVGEGYFDNWADRVVFACFDAISAVTSTGFSTFDYEVSGEFISHLVIIGMFFGGMAGSTSGGAKIDRLIVMLKNTRNEFYRVIHPNAVTSVRIDGKAMPHDVVAKVIAFLSIYLLIIIVGAVALAFMGLPIFDSMFSSMSAISSIGFGFGLTGEQVDSFALLPTAAKWLLSFEMLVGRLELFTVLVLFTKGFWVKE